MALHRAKMTPNALRKVMCIVAATFFFLSTPAMRIKARANPVQSFGGPGALSAANFSGNGLVSSSMSKPRGGPAGAIAGGFKTTASSQAAQVHATESVNRLFARGPGLEPYDEGFMHFLVNAPAPAGTSAVAAEAKPHTYSGHYNGLGLAGVGANIIAAVGLGVAAVLGGSPGQAEKGWLNQFDRVSVVENVIGKALNRWTQEGEHDFQLLQGDFGTVHSHPQLSSSSQVSVILDKDVEKEVWVSHTYLVKDDPLLKEIDNDAAIEDALKNFPQAEDMAIFKCPITKNFFRVPVVASDGRTYEQSALDVASDYSQSYVENSRIYSLLNALTEQVIVPWSAINRLVERFYEPDLGETRVNDPGILEFPLSKLQTLAILELEDQILDTNPPALGSGTVADFRCPISADFFRDPVVASDGHTYERHMIEEVLRRNQSISPITREVLSRDLIPNRAMKLLLSILIQKADLIQKAAYVQEVSGNNSKGDPVVEDKRSSDLDS